MSELVNRRKEARKLVVSFTLVYETTQGKLLGYLRDLNTGGAQISGTKALDEGTFAVLSIELPHDLPGVSKGALIMDARVARCTLVTETPKNYEVGFEFLSITPEQREIIEKLLAHYYFLRTAQEQEK